MEKAYILDTSVIIFDPEILYRITGASIFIPDTVIRELDGLKLGDSMAARNARSFSAVLDLLSSYQDLEHGVTNSFKNRIWIVPATVTAGRLQSFADGEIIGTAIELNKQTGQKIKLLTNDRYMRVTARAFGISAESYPSGMDDVDPKAVFEYASSYDRLAVEQCNDAHVKSDGGGIKSEKTVSSSTASKGTALRKVSGQRDTIFERIGSKLKFLFSSDKHTKAHVESVFNFEDDDIEQTYVSIKPSNESNGKI